MAPHDEHDFVDREYEKAQGTAWSEPERLAVDSDASSMATAGSAREQLDAKFGSTQQRLLALKQEQENWSPNALHWRNCVVGAVNMCVVATK